MPFTSPAAHFWTAFGFIFVLSVISGVMQSWVTNARHGRSKWTEGIRAFPGTTFSSADSKSTQPIIEWFFFKGARNFALSDFIKSIRLHALVIKNFCHFGFPLTSLIELDQGATRAQLIQMGIRLLRALREQLKNHRFIPCQTCSPSGSLPAGSLVPQWGPLGILHAEVLGYPLGFRLFKSSLSIWFNFRQR